MPQHALAGARTGRPERIWAAVVGWYDGRERAHLGDARGWFWTAVVAMSFFWMSNPVALIPTFYLSLALAVLWLKVAVVLNLPWLRLPRVPWPWVAFLAVGLLSQLWTIDDFHTDVSNTVYIKITAVAIAAAVHVEPRVVAWGIAAGGFVVVALSVHAFHEQVLGTSYAALEGVIFTGVGTNQNILAYTMAIALAVTLAIGWPTTTVPRVLWLLALASHGYGIYLANSGTGYVCTLIILVVAGTVAAWPRLRSGQRHLVLAWLGAAGVAFVLVLVFVVLVLGKELSTFSGRAPFWRATIETTLAHSPLWGSGWGAVWEHPWNVAQPPNPVASEIYERAGFALPHGHNLFVDLLPELGLLGIVLSLAMIAYAVRRVRQCGVRAGDPLPLSGRMILLVLVALLTFGVTEPMLTVPLGWWTFVLVVANSRQRTSPRVDRPARRAPRGRRVAL